MSKFMRISFIVICWLSWLRFLMAWLGLAWGDDRAIDPSVSASLAFLFYVAAHLLSERRA